MEWLSITLLCLTLICGVSKYEHLVLSVGWLCMNVLFCSLEWLSILSVEWRSMNVCGVAEYEPECVVFCLWNG